MNNLHCQNFIGNNNPCLYAIDAVHHARAKIVYYKHHNLGKNKIAKDLKSFLKALKGSPLNKPKTFIACFDDIEPSSRLEMAEFLLGILSTLRENDEKPWPNGKTSDIFDENFEFYYHKEVIFPILLCKNHDSEARKSTTTMIAFQPGRIFDYLKKVESSRYSTVRKSIHRRLDKIFGNDRPFYLSEKSSGRNIVQYLGFDPHEDYYNK